MKQNWFYQGICDDMCFCSGDCKNYDCNRNLSGKLIKKRQKMGIISYYSQSDFTDVCSAYIAEVV